VRLQQITLEGFGPWRAPTTIDLSGNDLIAMVGFNGSGKSSILDGVLWSLYGQVRAGGANGWISVGSDMCRVQVQLQLADGTQLQVERLRTASGKSSLMVQQRDHPDQDWAQIGDGSIGGGQTAIEQAVGASLELLLATSWLSQGDAARFSQASAAQRRQVLAEMLSLDWTGLATAARQKAQALTAALERQEINLAHWEAQATQTGSTQQQLATEQQQLTQAEQAMEQAQQQAVAVQDVQAAQTQWDRWAQSMQNGTAALTKYQARADQAQAGLQTAQRQAAAAPLPDEQRDKYLGRRSRHVTVHTTPSIETRLTEWAAHIAGARARQADLDERLGALRTLSEQCPLCLQGLSPDLCAKLVTETETERHQIQTQIEFWRHRQTQDQHRSTVVHNGLDQIETELRAQAQAQHRHELAQAALGTAQQELANAEQVKDDTTQRLELLRQQEPSKPDAHGFDLQQIQRNLTNAQQTHSSHLVALGRLQQQLEAAQHAQRQADQARPELQTARQRLEAVRLVARAASPSEVPTRIIESVLPALEDRTNFWLDKMSNGTMSLQLITERARSTGKGDTIPTLELMVAYQGSERPYATFSGGEKLKLDLACRLGIGALLAARAGAPIRTLIIDEGWGALDQDGINALIEALQALQDSFELIITVTHVPAVAAAFPARLEISRDGAGSTAQLIEEAA